VSAFAGFRLLLQKELREQLRTLRLVVVVAVLAAFGATSPLLAKLLPDIIKVAGTETAGLTITMPTPTTADAVAQLVKNLGQFGLLIAILVAMGSVATEKERGTAGFVLTKPVGRGPFIMAKAAAIGLLLAAGIAAGYALAWIYTAVLFEPLSLPGFAASGALLWLSLLLTGSVTFLFSVLARSSLVAGGAGFVALIVTGIVAAIPGIGAYAPTGLSTPAIALALGTARGDLAGPIIVNLALVGLALGAAQVAFRRQEL
jgi:ABC-2 type transport system permease protein